VIARHLQDEGEPPRRIVMDLWASPTLRSGGEDIAHALALMGAVPLWDDASTRVTGFAITPLPRLDASAHRRHRAHLRRLPRHVSRAKIALLDAAARAVAMLDEPDE
jgi:cobaltochelatase CobN